MRKVWMVVTVVAAVVCGTGCMSATDSVRRFATQDLNCPSAQIQIHRIASGAYVARGCGARSFYIDRNSPTAVAPVHQPGHAYVTLAVGEH
jgi:hypothetical protein